MDIRVIAWTEEGDTGYHDHDGSAGALASTEPTCAAWPVPARGGAVSVHAYSAALVRIGAYLPGADGTLRRERMSYVEEFRPLGAL